VGGEVAHEVGAEEAQCDADDTADKALHQGFTDDLQDDPATTPAQGLQRAEFTDAPGDARDREEAGHTERGDQHDERETLAKVVGQARGAGQGTGDLRGEIGRRLHRGGGYRSLDLGLGRVDVAGAGRLHVDGADLVRLAGQLLCLGERQVDVFRVTVG